MPLEFLESVQYFRRSEVGLEIAPPPPSGARYKNTPVGRGLKDQKIIIALVISYFAVRILTKSYFIVLYSHYKTTAPKNSSESSLDIFKLIPRNYIVIYEEVK